jgi:hypothetical protein
MNSMAHALERIKGRVSDAVPQELILGLCDAVGHRWRERDLGPVITTHLFLQQILHGNTACSHLRHLSGLSFTDSAYCQARARLPLALLERLQRAVTGNLADAAPPASLWRGHRVYHIDGSGFSMPDTEELHKYFGQPPGQAEGCGFPVARLLVRFDAATGYLVQTLAVPLDTSEISQVPSMHPELERGDVLVGDRVYGTYAHMALCAQRGIHGVFRAHQKQIIDFQPRRPHKSGRYHTKGPKGWPSSRWVKRLGRHDQVVEYIKPKERPLWMTAEAYAKLPDSMLVREVRYKIRRPGCRTREVTLVTTLLDPVAYPAKALAKLYGCRWQAETNLRHLKQTLGMDILHCMSVAGVLKELMLFVLVYNLVRRVMLEAGQRQQVDPERISFIDAWRWLQEARPNDALPKLIVNPYRPGRYEPRVRKRRPKQFPLMQRPRAELRKAFMDKQDAA